MDMQHTSGPWRESPDVARRVVSHKGFLVADVASSDADLKLIAAAPELLAAAESIAEHLNMWRDSLRDSSSWDIAEDRDVNAVFAALAKARGASFEPDCNHDAPAIVDGACECGTIIYDANDAEAAAEWAREHAPEHV